MLLDVGQNSLDQLALLGLTDLSLVTDVRVEDGFNIGNECGLLLEGEGLVLELGGLLERRETYETKSIRMRRRG